MSKTFFILLFFSMIVEENLSAQCINFFYDLAGDRISRNLCPQALLSPLDSTLNPNMIGLPFSNRENGITIYPNPSDGLINISSGLAPDKSPLFSPQSEILITDVLGRRWYHGKLSDGKVDLSRVISGQYFIRVMDGRKVSVVIVIKE